jgi:polysaccharide export outer membrane protein
MRRLSVLLAIALTACAGANKGQRATARSTPEYRIGREDVLEVVVWKEPELSKVMPVRPDGKIGMPLIGDVEAAGQTPVELQKTLTQRLDPLVKDASVAVLVREVNGSRFFVMGEVNKPGAYPLRGTVNVVQALAMAGGPGEYAGNEVVWLKQKSDGSQEKVSLSYRELVKGEADGDLALASGDVIVIP